MFTLILKYRNFLINTKYFKLCYGCDNVLPLFMFKKNNKKYVRPSQKGRCFNCVICVKNENK